MDLRDLQDQMTVLAAIQERQASIQKLQAEELDAVRARTVEMQKQLDITRAQLEVDRATSAQRMAECDLRIDKLVSGFGAFLGARPRGN